MSTEEHDSKFKEGNVSKDIGNAPKNFFGRNLLIFFVYVILWFFLDPGSDNVFYIFGLHECVLFVLAFYYFMNDNEKAAEESILVFFALPIVALIVGAGVTYILCGSGSGI